MSGLGGNKDYRRVTHERETVLELTLHRLESTGLLFDEVPLINSKNAGFTRVMGITCNLGVLFGNAFRRVDQDDTDVCFFDRGQRADHTVLFDLVLDTALLAKSRGIDDRELTVLILNYGVDRVSSRTRNIGNDRSFLAGHIVGERGFTGIRLTDQSDTDRLVAFLILIFLREVFVDSVEHLAESQSVRRGDRIDLTQSQIIELIELRRRFADMVDLIDCQNDRAICFSKHDRDLFVGSGQARLDITHEKDDVRGLDGDLGLHAHTL